MPNPTTIARARRDAAEGKSSSTQAGEFIREEIHRIRAGEHGARSTKQAIAIGLSEARRAGFGRVPAPGRTSTSVRRKAEQEVKEGQRGSTPSPRRSRAAVQALKREPRRAASTAALSRHAKQAARARGPAERSLSARKAAQTRRQP